jgi:RNA polymerase sigma-70 factor (ECF subfamily)
MTERRRREEEFELILERFGDKVFRLMLSMLRNAAMAEDATQDALLKIWQALDGYDGRASMSTWVYAIARNTALTRMRSESYRSTVPLDAVAEPAGSREEYEAGELRRQVAKLPEEQRIVVELFYFEERSVDDVAEMLGMPAGTVKSHLYRARKTLGEMVRR